MAERITEAKAVRMFGMLVAAAREAGKNPSGWRFGRPYGLYWVITTQGESGIRTVSPYWKTLREAYEGMDAMRMILGTD